MGPDSQLKTPTPSFVLTSATSHVLYVNVTNDMGDQVKFLQNLEGSAFFGYILNQYVSGGTFHVDPTPHYMTVATTSGYVDYLTPLMGSVCPPGESPYLNNGVQECSFLQFETYVPLTQIEMDLPALVGNQAGTNNIWHVIVSATNQLCWQTATLTCMGPGSGMLNACGFHSELAGQNGDIFFTMQQDVGACDTDTYADGISSTLSHELFETITDPDTMSGWRDNGDDEIGDICEAVTHWIALPYYTLGGSGTFYDIQPEWSNKDEHCYPEVDQSATLGTLP